MDNHVPVTGFERTIKIDLEGTRLNVPYGYLAGASRDGATRWPSDEEIVHPVEVFDIYVYPNWDGNKLTLEPFNQHNKDKFITKLKDGLADVDDILIYPKSKCNINVKNYKEIKLSSDYVKKINSYNKDYELYSEYIENPFFYEEFFYKDKGNVVVGRIKYKDVNKKEYRVSVSTCVDGISVSYYPTIKNIKDKNSIQSSVFQYQEELERLISSFIVK